MNIKRILSFFSILGLASCANQNITCYQFEDVIVTRVDYNNKSVFYYGHCNFNRGLCDSSRSFSVQYNFRGGIDLHMVFKKDDKRIGIIDYGLGYATYNDSVLFYRIKTSNSYLREEREAMFQDSNIGIIHISNNADLEKQWYNEEKSRVSYGACR